MGTEGRSGPVTLPPLSLLISTSGLHKDTVDIPLYHQLVWAPATRVTSFVFKNMWTELKYKYDMCRATRGVFSEHRYTTNRKSQKIDRIIY